MNVPVLPGERTAPFPPPLAQGPIAVIDLGSNSSRVVVLRLTGISHLDVLGDARVPLGLVREVDAKGRFGDKIVERAVRAVADFQAIAAGAGATRTIAVATAAVREASNGSALIARLHQELGVEVSVISAEDEARYAFLGAVNSLPVDHGLLVDLGGGSMQIVHFRDRNIRRSWSLPLGALRLSDRFLDSDPPAAAEVRRLVEHVRSALRAAGVPKLRSDEHFVGVGGTFRNLGKMDRHFHPYPLSRLHGYTMTRRRLKDLAAVVASRRAADRALLPGLNSDRVDSIVGGALAAMTVAEALAAPALMVSGEGLREGVALHAFGRQSMPAATARHDSLTALCVRFASWEAERAQQRSAVAMRLLDALDPAAPAEQRTTLEHAAFALDIGRSVDYYNRHEHAAQIVAATDLGGFSHRAIALLAATVLLAGQPNARLKTYRPILSDNDTPVVHRLAAVLALADALVHRTAPGQEAVLHCERRDRNLVVHVPAAGAWNGKREAERIRRHFGCDLTISASGR